MNRNVLGYDMFNLWQPLYCLASLKNICHWVDENPENLPCISYSLCLFTNLSTPLRWTQECTSQILLHVRACRLAARGVVSSQGQLSHLSGSACPCSEGQPDPKSKWGSCCCSVTKSCLILCHPMDYSMPGSSVLHSLPEFARIQVLWVSDAIQPSHPLLPPSPFAFNISQNQGLFQWVGFLHHVAKVLELQL